MYDIEKKFLDEEAKEEFRKYKKEFILNILKNEERLRNDLFKIIKDISEKSNNTEGFPISYIDLSLLQIGILNETFEISVFAYDNNWFVGKCIDNYFTIDYIFEGFIEIKNKLYEETKKYVGKVRKCCIDQYILDQQEIYNGYLTYFFIKFFKQWDEEQSFIDMRKGNSLKVMYGNYKDKSQTIYFYDNSKKTEKLFKEKIQMDDKANLVFDYWQNLSAKEFSIINKDITCINLKNSKLESFNIAYCKVVNANFKGSVLKKCRFKNCDLGECDFTNSTLENIIFEDCELRKVNFKNTKFINAYLINKEKMKKIIEK